MQTARSHLKEELLERIQRNPKYSLRSFARHLGISASTVSGVLAGKRRLSLKSATEIAQRLDWDPERAREFCQKVALDAMGDFTSVLKYDEIPAEIFKAISDWYHYAILEMTFLTSTKLSSNICAQKLGISFHEAKDAFERLERLGLLKYENKKWVKSKTHIAHTDGHASQARRRRHKQIIEKALKSLDEVPSDLRDISSITMAIDPKKLPEANRRITTFRRELCQFLEKGKRTQVYELAVQLFPLSSNLNSKLKGERK